MEETISLFLFLFLSKFFSHYFEININLEPRFDPFLWLLSFLDLENITEEVGNEENFADQNLRFDYDIQILEFFFPSPSHIHNYKLSRTSALTPPSQI